MGKKIFKENYKLLKEIASEIVTNIEPNFYLSREPEWIGEYYCKYGAFIDRYDEEHITVATFYYMNNLKISNKNEGNLTVDPEITIFIDNEKELARVTNFYIANPNIAMLMVGQPTLARDFECTADSKETDEERIYNEYLNEWLKEYKDDKETFEKRIIEEI